ncbi:MAG: aldo/keto reductase [Chloroflexi bacterium]|nr:MAG: aldo/keto reductase [Chloroflexota bacterium]
MVQSIQDKVALHNGVLMPLLGLGVFQSEDGTEVEQAIRWAFDVGYRSIDTATFYRNESGVGKAVRESGLPRSEVFVTTKVWNSDQGYDQTLRAFDISMKKLGLDYLDLYLIHWPVNGKYKDTWRAFETIYQTGRVKAIGVSNFLVPHLDDLLQSVNIAPMVNQIEFHPYLQTPDLVAYCRTHHIVVEAWSPIMRGQVLQVPELIQLGEKYNKSAVQVTLRWMLQLGIVTIPKSVKKERIQANAELFDFSLTDAEMEGINELDRGFRTGPDPDNFNF